VGIVWLVVGSLPGLAGEVKLVPRRHDPFGSPRPEPDQQHVPLRTSLHLQLTAGDQTDVVPEESVSIQLRPEGGEPFFVLEAGKKFAAGYRGTFTPGKREAQGQPLVVYVDSDRPLEPARRYTMRVQARSRSGGELAAKSGTWQFTTEAEPRPHAVHFDLSLTAPAVRWQGGFFSGFCGTSFATNHTQRIPTFELMDQVRRSAPRAWSLQRDFWLTGMEHQPQFLSGNLPNIVRERETRRITAIETVAGGVRLQIEDFFGHAQYGIESNRPPAADYHAGDEVLVADGVNHARATVVRADDKDHTVTVAKLDTPAGGWKLKYAAPLPTREDPNAPGLFPPGGCYLRKFRPTGTPVYYWGRLDHEWDLAIRRFNRRVIVNFADAPGDLSIDGRDWTTAKDYAELHDAVREIAGHIIDRFGARCLDFPWSVFNEPDLGPLFWRTDWSELQKFYDYTVDAILRAFEDRGYDSNRVFIGGLELGGIFGTNLKLREFLVHCAPRAAAVPGALLSNAAFLDGRLTGRRSRRVESLCRMHGGRGSPCDFISIHAYNTSKLMADKLARAKEMALAIDAQYYERLWVNSHESCPGWDVPPDPAFSDSYLGNGYFETWCADVARRQLARAAADPRYGYGESILTFWPWPSPNFEGRNDCVRLIQTDDNGDGIPDRAVTVAMPILHFLGLLNGKPSDYRVLPEQTIGGHVVSGLVAADDREIRLLVYSHHALDTESRSEAAFDVSVDLAGGRWPEAALREYRFDKEHHSYFRLGRSLRDQANPAERPDTAQRLREALQALQSDSAERQTAALDTLSELGPAAHSAAFPLLLFLQKTSDTTLRQKGEAVVKRVTLPRPYPAAVVRQIEKLAQLDVTTTRRLLADPAGRFSVQIPLAANGASFLVLTPPARQD
jgi:hypothetical protein